jgi:hypothetical protein
VQIGIVLQGIFITFNVTEKCKCVTEKITSKFAGKRNNIVESTEEKKVFFCIFDGVLKILHNAFCQHLNLKFSQIFKIHTH